MLGNRRTPRNTGCITVGIESNQLVMRIVDYVYRKLSVWRDDQTRPPNDAEDRLNSHLCKFLDSCARQDFPMVRFDHEEHQHGHRWADLSASPSLDLVIGAKSFSIYDPLLIIECKRLPAPSGDREHEYVTGGDARNGGIQRFKLGLYAVGHEVAILIGYVQAEDLAYWRATINGWISDMVNGTTTDATCVWQADEVLGEFSEEVLLGTARCRSSHARNSDVHPITLHHLWVKISE